MRKPNCSKHPTKIVGWEASLQALARAIGRMRYDKTAEFLRHLAWDLQDQSNEDRAAGRGMLAAKLVGCRFKVDEAASDMERIWKICEPYMKKVKDK